MSATTTARPTKKKAAAKKTPPPLAATSAANPAANQPAASTTVFDDIAPDAMKQLGLRASTLLDQIHGYFPELVGMTEQDRRVSKGKLRAGEDSALVAILQVTQTFPQFFQGLADQDFGADPSTFESQLLLDRISRRDVLATVGAELHELATLFDDTVLKLGDLVRPPALAAYKIAAPLASSNAKLKTQLKPALDFFGGIGKKAATTRKKKKAAQKKANPST